MDKQNILQTNFGPVFVKQCSNQGIHLVIGPIAVYLGKEAAQFLVKELDLLISEETALSNPLELLKFGQSVPN